MIMRDLSRENTDIADQGPRIFKPSLSISAGQMPELKVASIGDKVKLTIECTVYDVCPAGEFDPRAEQVVNLICEKGAVISIKKVSPLRDSVSVVDGIPRSPAQGSTPPDSGQFGGGF